MAFANVQTSGKLRSNTGAALSWTPSTAPTLNNLLTCRAWMWDASMNIAAGNVKDSSGTAKTFNLDKAGTKNSGNSNAGIFSLVVPSGLTTPLKAQFTTFNDNLAVFDEWSGNATTSVLDQINASTSNSAASGVSGSINTGANAGLALAVVTENVPGTTTISSSGTSFTQDASESDNNNYEAGAAASRTATVASQTGLQETWTWTGGTTQYTAVIASYNASASSTTAYPFPTVLRLMEWDF